MSLRGVGRVSEPPCSRETSVDGVLVNCLFGLRQLHYGLDVIWRKRLTFAVSEQVNIYRFKTTHVNRSANSMNIDEFTPQTGITAKRRDRRWQIKKKKRLWTDGHWGMVLFRHVFTMNLSCHCLIISRIMCMILHRRGITVFSCLRWILHKRVVYITRRITRRKVYIHTHTTDNEHFTSSTSRCLPQPWLWQSEWVIF